MKNYYTQHWPSANHSKFIIVTVLSELPVSIWRNDELLRCRCEEFPEINVVWRHLLVPLIDPNDVLKDML